MKLGSALNIIAEDFERDDDRQPFIRLAQYFFAHQKEIKHLTYSSIAQVAGITRPDKLLQVTQYLSGERVKLLRMKFELIIDDDIFPLDDETMYHAETTGDLIHPETGRRVDDYDRLVYPYFILSEEVENG